MTDGRPISRRAASPQRSPLFANPYWYRRLGPHSGETGALDPVRLLEQIQPVYSIEDLAAQIERTLGTWVTSEWAPVAVTNATLAFFDRVSGVVVGGTTPVAVALELAGDAPAPSDEFVHGDFAGTAPKEDRDSVSSVADEVRRLSGLIVDDLAALFPDGRGGRGRMSRENYHRWISGATEPGSANLQRLLGLRALLRAAFDRVGDVHTWLLSPMDEEFATPYDLLRAGALTRVWGALGRLPSRAPRIVVADSEGGTGVRIDSSLRSDPRAPTIDDLDDTSDWIGG